VEEAQTRDEKAGLHLCSVARRAATDGPADSRVPRCECGLGRHGASGWRGLGMARPRETARGSDTEGGRGLARARALWSARRRGAGMFQRERFDVGHFDRVFLPKLELKCFEG
jgi:hypothetical protein